MAKHQKIYDEFLEEALDLCVMLDEISPLLLQTYFDVSYRRASRIFGELRELKVIAHVRFEEAHEGPMQIGKVNRETLRLSLLN